MQYFELVNEVDRIGTCRMADIPKPVMKDIIAKGENLNAITFFYDKEQDAVVINKDYEHYNDFLGITQAFLGLSIEGKKKALEMVPDELHHAMVILGAVAIYRHSANH